MHKPLDDASSLSDQPTRRPIYRKRDITLKIPCKPHVFIYLQAKFPNPYRLSLADWLGICVYHILKRQESDKYYITDRDEYSSTLEVVVPENTIINYGLVNITDYTIYKINNLVESIMYQNFLEQVHSRPEGMPVKQAILEWISRNSFTEGDFINYDNLKQKYFRFRKKLENNSED